MRFPGRFASLDAIRRFAAQAAREAGLNDDEIYAVQLAVDEACSNIIEHGYGGEERGEIECQCTIEPDRFIVTIQDQGARFDPTQATEPDVHCELEKRPIGGLGLYLIRRLMDDVEFETSERGNTLRLIKRRRTEQYTSDK